jgi:glycosyltransferase involved in cell wall biosynthesis
MNITVAIPTLGRDDVLIETIEELLQLNKPANEVIIIDQTETHSHRTTSQLKSWHQHKKIYWINIRYKSITRAMNIALRKSTSERVLFLDDDIIPDKNLINAYLDFAYKEPSAIIAGRVLQPWHNGKEDLPESPFLFNSLEQTEVTSFMGGNVLIPRDEAIRIGGFDTNFVRVAYHFEAEFAHRWVSNGNRIFYEPKALIHHLKTERGGTRSYGNHLTTIRPDHSVGRHYYYLCKYFLKGGLYRSMRDISKSFLTRYHLRNPLYIPLTLIAEITGLLWALILFKSGRGTIIGLRESLLVISSHPIQYYSPIFRILHQSPGFKTDVLYLTLPDARSQSLGFEQDFTWDIPLLDGYNYNVVKGYAGKGLINGFMGVKIKNPWREMRKVTKVGKPDAVLFTGWHFWGMVQLFIALKISNIPIILRMDSNSLRQRSFLHRWIYRTFFSWVDICLTVGRHNRKFCIHSGMNSAHLIRSPHAVDNKFFHTKSKEYRKDLDRIRADWKIPSNAFCFLYAGKLQLKKRPLDLLKAFRDALNLTTQEVHLLMVGSGPLEEHCRIFSAEFHLPVSFVGFLNQTKMPEAYSVSDCIVLPSDEGETWGLVINEAMACGLPAIVSENVGCSPDLVINGKTGFTFECGDTLELARHLVYMAEHIHVSQQMGENAQRLVLSKYNLERVAKSIETAMHHLNG